MSTTIENILIAGGLIFSVFGPPMVRFGYKHWQVSRSVAGTPTSDIRDLDDEGVVALHGEVVSADGTFRSPVAQCEETVLAAWRAEDWKKHGNPGGWKAIAWGIDSTPFYLDDGTGRVLVDPGDHFVPMGFLHLIYFNVSDPEWGIWLNDVVCNLDGLPVERRVDLDEPTPEHLQELVDSEVYLSPQSGSSSPLPETSSNTDGDRRYSEEQVRAGDEIYLLGHASAESDATHPLGPEDLVVQPSDDSDSPLVVSESVESPSADHRSTARYYLAVGITFTISGPIMFWLGLP